MRRSLFSTSIQYDIQSIIANIRDYRQVLLLWTLACYRPRPSLDGFLQQRHALWSFIVALKCTEAVKSTTLSHLKIVRRFCVNEEHYQE